MESDSRIETGTSESRTKHDGDTGGTPDSKIDENDSRDSKLEDILSEDSFSDENGTADSKIDGTGTTESTVRHDEDPEETPDSKTGENESRDSKITENETKESRSNEGLSEDSRTDENGTGDSKIDETGTGESITRDDEDTGETMDSKTDENESKDSKLDEIGSEDSKTGENGTGDSKMDENESRDSKLDDVGSEDSKTDENGTGDSKMDENESRDSKSDDIGREDSKPDENITGDSKVGETGGKESKVDEAVTKKSNNIESENMDTNEDKPETPVITIDSSTENDSSSSETEDDDDDKSHAGAGKPDEGDSDDDLMILDEIPAKKKNPDLNMDCIDEPMDATQRIKRLKDLKVYRDTMRLLKKWSLRRRIVSRNGSLSIVAGTCTAPAPRVNIRVNQAAPTPAPGHIQIQGSRPLRPPLQQRAPITILRQKNANAGILVRPNLQPIPTTVLQTTANRPPAYSQTYVIHHRPNTLPGQTVQLTRPVMSQSGSVAIQNNMLQQMQRLVFDPATGLLHLPQQQGSVPINATLGVGVTPSVTNIRSLSSTRPSLPLRPERPKLSAVRTTLNRIPTPKNTVTVPRIVATASLQNKQQMAPGPLSKKTTNHNQPSTAAPKTASQAISKPSNQSQVSAKLGTQNAQVQKLANQNQTTQMETTNPIGNGPQADKDPNNNRTYPSLVVVVKPCLADKITRAALNAARGELDLRVKSLLLYSASKLTEWLMQQGLLRLEHRCPLHMTSNRENIKYKLGMYSDGSKQPFSGGYVWIAECCPEKQISVFHGSIFESTVYTPGTIMKLIYHWSCQTAAQNVLQWVKVSNYYLKNFYTLLRSVCTAALHELSVLMGGKGKVVEVGVITLGTALTQTSSTQKPFKVDILGVFDPAAKSIRLKVINPVGNPSENPSRARVQQILHPLLHWVDKESTLLIDTSIEKNFLMEMGFKSVHQSKAGATPTASTQTNANVMNYLKNVVPKMFSATLCVLSKSLIQQFLDELAWREIWGSTSEATFNNIINHLVQMTKWELGETLISRLNKISMNPFGEWSYTRGDGELLSGIDMLPDSIRGIGMPTLQAYADYADSISSNGPPPPHQKAKRKESHNTQQQQQPMITLEINNSNRKRKLGEEKDELKKYLFSHLTDFDPFINVYTYYYAQTKPDKDRTITGQFPNNLKCPLCSKSFLNNLEIIRHVAIHVYSLGRPSAHTVFCEFCLKELQGTTAYSVHIAEVHRQEEVEFPCLICLEAFRNKTDLILHMYENHKKADMPYRCEVCDYRNSRHMELVEHFNKEHIGSDCILCPICLKMLGCRNVGDMKQVVVHLQSHSGRKGRKCGECVLNFGCDLDFRSHVATGSHEEPKSSIPICTLKSLEDKVLNIPKPPKTAKSRQQTYQPAAKKHKTGPRSQTQKQSKPEDPALQLENIKFYLPKDEEEDEVYLCAECHKDIKNPNHFTGCFKCSKCAFGSSCEMSMLTHNRNTHPLGKPKLHIASFPTILNDNSQIKCSCGFTTPPNTSIMSHLVKCGRRTGTLEENLGLNELDEMPQLEAEGSLLSQLGLIPRSDSNI